MISGKGKTALITGATSGIGKEIARFHAQLGGDLVLVSGDKLALEDFEKEIRLKFGVSVLCLCKDLCKASAAREIYQEVVAAGLTVDFLINDAGFDDLGRCSDQGNSMAMIDLHIIALASLTRQFLPMFKERNRGRILNVSSTSEKIPNSMQAVYLASKAFVTYFSNVVSEELSGTNITVTNLMPGSAKTQFLSGPGGLAEPQPRREVSPQKIAVNGYKAMISGKMDFFSGLPQGRNQTYTFSPMASHKTTARTVRRVQEIF